MQAGDILYNAYRKRLGVIIETTDDINFLCHWYDNMDSTKEVHYAQIMEYWRAGQKLKSQ